jgi:hypothetical protein
MSNLITLIGGPGSGKSSIALAYSLLYGGTKLSFAGGVKDEAAAALAAADKVHDESVNTVQRSMLHRRQMDDPAVKDQYRRLLQVWGTELRRQQDPDYWVDALRPRAAAALKRGDVLIDDMRFPNEKAAVMAAGGIVVFLEHGDTSRVQIPEAASHESEAHWPTWTPDITLTYVPGPAHQAERLRTAIAEHLAALAAGA